MTATSGNLDLGVIWKGILFEYMYAKYEVSIS